MSQGRADRRRVVVTGLGCVSPLGKDAASTWDAAVAGKSGAGEIGAFDATEIAVHIAAECRSPIDLPGVSVKDTRRYDRCMQLALQAAVEAVGDAQLDLDSIDRERLGIAVGTGIGGVNTLLSNYKTMLEKGPRRLSPFTVPMALANMPSGVLAMYYGARGPNISPVGACASGAQGIAEAVHSIERGEADVMIAGGTESAIHPLVVAGFAAMRALSTRNDDPAGASRPFDEGRDGFLIAEGAAMVVLEAEDAALRRGAPVRAELLGSGVAADAAHIALPAEDGAGARLAMERALASARVNPEEIDHINAHATSTPAGDQVEAMAIREVFGDASAGLPVSATKSMTGHLLGAAGALEAIFCIRAIEEGVLPPTINLEKLSPGCELDHVANEARKHDTKIALSNAFGFGGINVSLVLGRPSS
jgi:3-oxoacyl-[acyl-carrier-protein] synthase II